MGREPRRAGAPFIEEPLWYKDAIIYQLHVKSFYDANNDGIGDFPGLLAKLDYIAELGVNAIWLLPFYPSPWLDDGYDIADYRGVHPDYGKLTDVKRFIQAAHERGIRVITELVVNHTSDQHRWFQRARIAKSGSALRNFYVWSDNDQKYAGTRIIFVDSERSNWTWDTVAGAYYWHRFYAHQPDLNFDNPLVLRQLLAVLRFWADLGVDGLRLDAVPYLVEREGTNNENLPETHAVLRKIRAALDARYPDRMLLAEANQWPEDTKEYFGDGDECHMAFHFPLMPRMYLAIAREDRFPITDILRQTPEIPEDCQWAIFLRNHDELTLEMVTDSERDFLWETYAADRRSRLNLGIRRRLAPLMEHDRRRIELMNHLLLSMPGTPVIYYGDEIGMGDNIHLGDRNGVRTPMQWSPDRNGGFSRADPSRLVSPVIMDPQYGYEAVNVEAQASDPHSLLSWMRRTIATRRKHQAFGRGGFRLLYPKNRKVLAFLREYRDETMLCVANLARTPQATELDLSELRGRIPIELDGGSVFPPIGDLPYLLTLAPYGFYWFQLAEETAWPSLHSPVPEPMPEYQTIIVRHGLVEAIGSARGVLEREVLPPYLTVRRWFTLTDLRSVRIGPLTPVPGADLLFAEIEAVTSSGKSHWLLPLGIAWEDQPSIPLAAQLALARVRRGARIGLLTDAIALPSFARALAHGLAAGGTHAGTPGVLQFESTARMREVTIPADADIDHVSPEQQSPLLSVGNAITLRMFRRLMDGPRPAVELTQFLTAAGFKNIPRALGEVVLTGSDDAPHPVAIVESYIRNQGNAWNFTLDLLMRKLSDLAGSDDAATDADHLADYDALATLLGRRLGELHDVLKHGSNDPAFAPDHADASTAQRWAEKAADHVAAAFDALDVHEDWTEALAPEFSRLRPMRDRLTNLVHAVAKSGIGSELTRIHGDARLSHVLVANGDIYFIGLGGNPSEPTHARRSKQSQQRDVAFMILSFDHVAAAVAERSRESHAHLADARRMAFLDGFVARATDTFLAGYCAVIDYADPDAWRNLLNLFLIDESAYQIALGGGDGPEAVQGPLRTLGRLANAVLAGMEV